MKVTYRRGTSGRLERFIVGCGCFPLALSANLYLGGVSIEYILSVVFHTAIPFLGAAFIGLFGGEFTIPAAVIVWFLKLFRVF